MPTNEMRVAHQTIRSAPNSDKIVSSELAGTTWWLLERGYLMHAKDYSGQRAEKLAKSVTAPRAKAARLLTVPPHSHLSQPQCLQTPMQDVECRIPITIHHQPAVWAIAPICCGASSSNTII